MLDPQDDFARVTDGLVEVTLVRSASAATTTIAHALRQPVRLRPVERLVAEVATDVIWHLPVAELPEPPRPGDAILDGATARWTVLSVRPTAMNGRWRCAARDLARAYGLDQRVDVERSSLVGGETVWNPWRTGIAARIRIAETAMSETGGVRRSIARLTILLAEDLAITADDRIKGPDGTAYTIVALRPRTGLGVPVEVDAEREA